MCCFHWLTGSCPGGGAALPVGPSARVPLGPTGYGDSPYSSLSAFAGNTNLVSPEKLVESGLLADADVQDAPELPPARVDYGRVIGHKRGLLEKAFQNFKRKLPTDEGLRRDYEGFHGFASVWLDDYALFAALRDEHKGAGWNGWGAGLAKREPAAVEGARRGFAERIEAHRFFQYAFFQQWLKLKKYANERGVRVVGDMPIFVAHDSADVWSRPEMFKLKDDGAPAFVAGVPHDTHLPHEYTRSTVAYTGTHDNDSVVGWFRQRSREEASEDEKRERENCLKYLASEGREINWDFIRAAQMSVADIAVAQLQDVLGLGSEARMNTPASAEGNWAWRFREGALTDELRGRLREMTATYGRLRDG